MQKQKFDEIVSYFNKKVSEMEIETKYKMELLGMVTALGYAHEKETHDKRTHACDLIDRRGAIEALADWEMTYDWDDHCREEDPKPAYIVSPSDVIEHLPSAQPEVRTQMSSADCISRQAAIKALHDEIVRRRINEDTNDDGSLDEFDTEAILRRLPSAQQWIPMTVKLPNHELELVQYSDGDFDLLQFPTAYRRKDIVAWMPLPEPYKERREE